MKKLSIAFALVLALALCVFCFASCGKDKKGDATTAPATNPSTTADGATEHVHTPGAEKVIDVEATCAAPGSKSFHCTVCEQIIPETVEEIPALPHTPEAEFYIEREPTCTTAGSKVKFCEVCGAEIPETREEIAIDPNAHEADPDSIVIVEPTLLAPEGSVTATCKYCNTPIVDKLEEVIYVIDSKMDVNARADWNEANGVEWLNDKDLETGVYIRQNINSIKDDDVHYYPTEENMLGNDLLVEVSFLWNETLANTYSWEAMTFGHIDGYDVFNVDSKIHPKDNRVEKDSNKVVTYTYQYSYVYPTEGTHTPSTGEYGWHRLGFRVHEDAEIVAGEVKYTYLASCYLDGALKVTLDMTDWVVNRKKVSTVTALLYTAEIDAEDPTKLNYFDIGDADAQSNFLTSYGLIFFEEFFNTPGGYFTFCDLSMTCGQDFVQDVEANAAPADATFTLDDKGTADDTTDDLVVPAKIWYKAK